MRVLHLVQPGTERAEAAVAPRGDARLTDAAVIFAGDAARRGGGDVCIFGDAGAEARARALGLATPHRITAPLGAPILACAGLRSLWRRRGPYDAVLCWSRGTTAAAAACGMPTVDRTLWRPDQGAAARAAAAMWPDPASAREWICGRFEEELGFEPGLPVVGMLADPAGAADAAWFTALISLMEKGGIAASWIAPLGAWRRSRGVAMAESLGLRSRLAFTGLPVHTLLPAIDVAVMPPVTRGGAPGEAREIAARFAAALAAAAGARVIGAHDFPAEGEGPRPRLPRDSSRGAAGSLILTALREIGAPA